MSTDNNNLESFYGDLSQTTVMNFLKGNGYSVTKTTLTRYIQAGLVLAPMKKSFRGSNRDASRVFYHPASIVEFMTAYLMFKGDWRVINSDVRIPRFTIEDIFLAHISFVSNNQDIAKYEDGLEFDIYFDGYLPDSPYIELKSEDSKYAKARHVVSPSAVDVFLNHHLKKLSIESNAEDFGKSYINFLYCIYSEIFVYLLKHHIKELNQFFNCADESALTGHADKQSVSAKSLFGKLSL